MPVLEIEDPEAYDLAAAIAERTGKSLTRVVVEALRQEKDRLLPDAWDQEEIDAILARVDALPDLDSRSPEEIAASLYDERGLIR